MSDNNWSSFVDHFLQSIEKSVPCTKFFVYETSKDQSKLNWFNYQNIPTQAMDFYLNKMHKYDPVYFTNNLDNKEEIILLNNQKVTPKYQNFLKDIHVIDNVELVFKTDNQSIKGISLIRGDHEQRFSDHELMTIQTCHSIVKHSLKCIHLEPSPQDMIQNDLMHDSLTNKEKKILSLLLEGKKNQDIANLLFVSLATVKTHIQHIFKKLLVKSKFELMSKYYQNDYKV